MAFPRTFEGRAPCLAESETGPYRLPVAIPCQVGELPRTIHALLDTAAEWSVLPQDIAAALDYQADPGDPWLCLETRLGTFSSQLIRVPLRFPAAEGESLTIEATCILGPDWPGPMVLGWKGCLERFRFTLDPEADTFYFGGL